MDWSRLEDSKTTLRKAHVKMRRVKEELYECDNPERCQELVNEVAFLGDQIRKLRKELIGHERTIM